MPESESDEVPPATTATSATPRTVRGLLDVVEAEANGKAWSLDSNDTLAWVGLGHGASGEARELVLLGLAHRLETERAMKLTRIKSQRGAPKKALTINMKRAAAVLGADDLLSDKFGKSAATQLDAIRVAIQIDEILCKSDESRKPLFSNMTSLPRIQTSVSKGLKELNHSGKRFSKK